MAIKVSGTTVIDNSRQLTNIASVDATTVAALSAAGVGAGGGTITATADGAISAGDAVVLQSNGTVKAVTETIVYLSNITASADVELQGNNATESFRNLHYYPSLDCYIWFGSSGGAVYAWVFEYDYSTNTVTMRQNATSLGSDLSQDLCSAFNPSNGQFIVAWKTTGYYIRYRMGAIATLTTMDKAGPSAGTDLMASGSQSYSIAAAVSQTDNYFRLAFYKSGDGQRVTTLGLSGTNVTNAGTANLSDHVQGHSSISLAWDSDNNRFMYTERADSASDWGIARYFSTSTSNGAITIHNSSYFEASTSVSNTVVAYNPEYQKFVLSYSRGSGGQAVRFLNISGSSFGISSAVQILSFNAYQATDLIYDPDTDKMIYLYQTGGTAYARTVDVSTSSISLGTGISIRSTTNAYQMNIAYDSTNKQFLVATKNSSTAQTRLSEIQSVTSTTNNANWIGFASEAIADTASGDILVVGSTDENQSGLTIGSTYYVQPNGSLATTSANAIKAGRALSATKLLITEGNA